jgi:hypothetical protein
MGETQVPGSRGPISTSDRFFLLVLLVSTIQVTIIKMAPKSTLTFTKVDCQFLALLVLVLHTVAVHGDEVAFSELPTPARTIDQKRVKGGVVRT